MIGQTVSHYKILHRIGGGGMGVVYKAEDTKLNRVVAVKFPPPAVTNDPGVKDRFVREARAASSLDHPNICTIHEIDETEDGQLFLVMAYYEGETLAERIRKGPLPIPETLSIARQLLSALARAHDSGIIHRDIKPANIIVTHRQEVKILDFGLAKFLDQTDLTQPGALLGTVAYMSPEQLSGRPMDHRSDIWAAGAVLYEMLTGQRPFSGFPDHSIIGAILHEEVKPVLSLRRDAPPAIDRIIRKVLAKDPRLRYQTAHEFLRDLDFLLTPSAEPTTVTLAAAVPTPSERLILVLPFVNLHADRESDYFSDGLTDEIITDLSSINALRVISRTSAMRLKGASEDLKQITKELNIHYILEGSVRKMGSDLRITAKLIDALTGSLLWADKYSGNLEDVFTIQEMLSRKIVEALKLKLSPEEEEKLAEKPIPDVRAYECYLMAKQEVLRYSKEGLERALEYLQRAVGIVGENLLLTSALGQVYWQFINAGISSDPSYLDKARECAQRILTLDPESAHGFRLLGLVQILQGNTQEAARLLKQALAKDPNDSDSLAWLVSFYGFNGKPYAAVPLVRKLLEIDPLTPPYQCMPGFLALMAGEFGRALEPFAKGFKMDPSNHIVRFIYGQILALNKRADEAIEIFDALNRDLPDSFFAKLAAFYKHALQGNRVEALEAATADLKDAAASDPQNCWNVAQGYALINEKQEALDWLERAVNLGFINYPLLSRLDPFLESIRDEPRFEPLMDKVRERWEAFEV